MCASKVRAVYGRLRRPNPATKPGDPDSATRPDDPDPVPRSDTETRATSTCRLDRLSLRQLGPPVSSGSRSCVNAWCGHGDSAARHPIRCGRGVCAGSRLGSRAKDAHPGWATRGRPFRWSGRALMKRGPIAVSQGKNRGGWSQNANLHFRIRCAMRLPTLEREAVESPGGLWVTLVGQPQAGFALRTDDDRTPGKVSQPCRPQLAIVGSLKPATALEALALESRVEFLGQQGAWRLRAPSHGVSVGAVVVAPAGGARAMAGCECHRVVEEEERRPPSWTCERPAPTLELRPADDPERRTVMANHTLFVIDHTAAVSGEHPTSADSLEVAPRIDAITSWRVVKILNCFVRHRRAQPPFIQPSSRQRSLRTRRRAT